MASDAVGRVRAVEDRCAPRSRRARGWRARAAAPRATSPASGPLRAAPRGAEHARRRGASGQAPGAWERRGRSLQQALRVALHGLLEQRIARAAPAPRARGGGTPPAPCACPCPGSRCPCAAGFALAVLAALASRSPSSLLAAWFCAISSSRCASCWCSRPCSPSPSSSARSASRIACSASLEAIEHLLAACCGRRPAPFLPSFSARSASFSSSLPDFARSPLARSDAAWRSCSARPRPRRARARRSRAARPASRPARSSGKNPPLSLAERASRRRARCSALLPLSTASRGSAALERAGHRLGLLAPGRRRRLGRAGIAARRGQALHRLADGLGVLLRLLAQRLELLGRRGACSIASRDLVHLAPRGRARAPRAPRCPAAISCSAAEASFGSGGAPTARPTPRRPRRRRPRTTAPAGAAAPRDRAPRARRGTVGGLARAGDAAQIVRRRSRRDRGRDRRAAASACRRRRAPATAASRRACAARALRARAPRARPPRRPRRRRRRAAWRRVSRVARAARAHRRRRTPGARPRSPRASFWCVAGPRRAFSASSALARRRS